MRLHLSLAMLKKARLSKHRRMLICWTAVVLFFTVLYGPTIVHLVREFYTRTNFNNKLCNHFHSFTGYKQNAPIPRIIHQIYSNESGSLMETWSSLQLKQQTWRAKNPDHEYILWNTTMIETLLNKSYPNVKFIYKRYRNNWNIQSDIARYIIIHHMGGVYADIRTTCKRSMSELYSQIGDKSVVLNFTWNPMGVSTDFFIASKNHEFMAHVIDGLEEADVFYLTPYVNTMFRTGPMFMLGRYLNYPHQEDIYLIPQSSIYIDSQSWHNVDGQFIAIVWDGISPIQIFSVILMIVFIVRLTQLIRIRRTLIQHSKRQVRRFHRHNKFTVHKFAIPEEESI